MLVTIEKVLLLKQMPAFKTVSNMALSDLMAVSEEQTIKKGEVLVESGKQNRNVYFLLSGSLEMQALEKKTVITAQTIVGLDSVFWSFPAVSSLIVKQKSVILKTERDKLYRMMALHPSLAMALLNELSNLVHS